MNLYERYIPPRLGEIEREYAGRPKTMEYLYKGVAQRPE